MEIYSFDEKTMEQRLQDYSEIFKSTDPEGDFKQLFKGNKKAMELCNAMWKVPKKTCKESRIDYPAEVFGVLTFVKDWKFKGNFKVVGTRSGYLEEKNLVNLEDIYPTKRQDNKSKHINAYLAADIIDRWRFFKQHILMPWEDIDNWKSNEHLEPRLRLFYDLKSGKIDKRLRYHIRHLVDHAARLKVQKDNFYEFANAPYSSDSDGEAQCEALMKSLQFRRQFVPIMIEFEFFVYPTVKKIYPDLEDAVADLKLEKQIFAVSENPEFLNDVKKDIPGDANVQLAESLDEVLLKTVKNVEIHLSIGQHTMTSSEFLSYISISGDKAFTIADYPDDLSLIYSVVTYSKDYDKCFLVNIVGNAILENLVIDRGLTADGILIAAGNVKIKNCLIRASSRYNKGLTILSGATVILENCVIQGFYIGIALEKGAKLTLKNSTIKNCMDGLEILGKCETILENSSIANSGEHAIMQFVKKTVNDEKVIVKDLMAEPEKVDIQFVGDCKFEHNQDGDAAIIPVSNNEVSEADVFFESDDEN